MTIATAAGSGHHKQHTLGFFLHMTKSLPAHTGVARGAVVKQACTPMRGMLHLQQPLGSMHMQGCI